MNWRPVAGIFFSLACSHETAKSDKAHAPDDFGPPHSTAESLECPDTPLTGFFAARTSTDDREGLLVVNQPGTFCELATIDWTANPHGQEAWKQGALVYGSLSSTGTLVVEDVYFAVGEGEPLSNEDFAEKRGVFSGILRMPRGSQLVKVNASSILISDNDNFAAAGLSGSALEQFLDSWVIGRGLALGDVLEPHRTFTASAAWIYRPAFGIFDTSWCLADCQDQVLAVDKQGRFKFSSFEEPDGGSPGGWVVGSEGLMSKVDTSVTPHRLIKTNDGASPDYCIFEEGSSVANKENCTYPSDDRHFRIQCSSHDYPSAFAEGVGNCYAAASPQRPGT